MSLSPANAESLVAYPSHARWTTAQRDSSGRQDQEPKAVRVPREFRPPVRYHLTSKWEFKSEFVSDSLYVEPVRFFRPLGTPWAILDWTEAIVKHFAVFSQNSSRGRNLRDSPRNMDLQQRYGPAANCPATPGPMAEPAPDGGGRTCSNANAPGLFAAAASLRAACRVGRPGDAHWLPRRNARTMALLSSSPNPAASARSSSRRCNDDNGNSVPVRWAAARIRPTSLRC